MSNSITDMRFLEKVVPDKERNKEAGVAEGNCLYEKKIKILQFRVGQIRYGGDVIWTEWEDIRTERE